MAHANFNIGLKVILKNSKGKILGLEAHKNGPMADYYDLPGGRIDDNEIGKPFLEVLAREIEEELGEIDYQLDDKPATALSWEWPNGQAMTFIYWEGLYQSGELAITDEHLSHQWIEPTEEELNKHFTSYHRQAFRNIKTAR